MGKLHFCCRNKAEIRNEVIQTMFMTSPNIFVVLKSSWPTLCSCQVLLCQIPNGRVTLAGVGAFSPPPPTVKGLSWTLSKIGSAKNSLGYVYTG